MEDDRDPHRRRLAVSAVALVLVFLILWIVRQGESQLPLGGSAGEEARPPEAPAPPVLLGGSDGESPPAAPEGPPEAAETGMPAKAGAAAPATRGTEAREKQGRPIKLRLELLRAGAPPERILIDNVYYRGNVLDGRSLNEMPNLVRVEAGRGIALSTRDERAGVEFVRATIPDPVPDMLTLRIPDRDTRHDARLVLEVVDAESGRPIPDAAIEWGDRARSPARQLADENGRIPVRLAEGETLTGPAVLMFELAESWIHAPGYRGVGTPKGTREWIPSLDAAAYARWADLGVHRIRLRKVPEELEEARSRIRILEHDGRPASDLYVFLVHPIEARRGMFMDGWHDGFRRTDSQGALQTSGEGVIGLDVWRGPLWIGSYVVALDASERVIRLPRLEAVVLEIDDVPDGGGWWSLDDLGPKRTPTDGPAYPANMDAAARAWIEERGLVVPVGLRTTRGTIDGSRATVRLAVPVGGERSVWLHVGSDRRVWKASASSGRVSLRWNDLPVPEAEKR